VRNRC